MFINREEGAVILIYTDDCLCFAWDDAELDELVTNMQNRGHMLDEQSMINDVYAYLGIELNMQGDKVDATKGTH